MKLRVSFIILAILGSIGAILTLAKYPSGPNTINYDEPWQIFTAIVTISECFTSFNIRILQ